MLNSYKDRYPNHYLSLWTKIIFNRIIIWILNILGTFKSIRSSELMQFLDVSQYWYLLKNSKRCKFEPISWNKFLTSKSDCYRTSRLFTLSLKYSIGTFVGVNVTCVSIRTDANFKGFYPPIIVIIMFYLYNILTIENNCK